MKKGDTAFYGWRVANEAKDVKSFVKFTISKSTKDKKTNKWNSVYIDVLCGDKLASVATRTALKGTYVYVRGNLTVSVYKDKIQLSMFADELEPMQKDDYDAAIANIPSPLKTMEDNLPW